jgi:hypothetical protein
MKTLLIISLLFIAASMAAQRDTIRYLGGVPQYDYLKLSRQIDAINNNLDMYAAQRRQAFFWMGGSVITSMAVTGFNLNNNEPYPSLYLIPAAMSIVGIIKLLSADKHLRKVEVTGSGVRVKF